jgi:hypothetical protein
MGRLTCVAVAAERRRGLDEPSATGSAEFAHRAPGSPSSIASSIASSPTSLATCGTGPTWRSIAGRAVCVRRAR